MRKLLLATSALVPLGFAGALANPLGGNVVGGGATISGTGTSNVTINQSTQNAVINWQTFNIATGERTQFIQPNSTSTVLNRVLGDPNPSMINGLLTANGRVFLINPNGILIGNGAVINTASFLASTHDITNENFMAGRYIFNIPGRPDASIVNLGTITASNSGFAALVAPGVRNSGTITATFGKIGLASANGFSLDLYGDQLIKLDVNDQIAGTVRDVATGETLKSLVQNDGKLSANGGRVELTAVAARQVVDSVINTSGVIEARSIGQHAGKIVLGAATGASKPAGAPKQTVKVSGKLSVASADGKGGKIQVTGENIEVANASIDASGLTGGGTVLIGGDIGGGRGNPLVTVSLEGYSVPNASTVSIDGNTIINASALAGGDGGKVVIWSDNTTSFAGQILARGGDGWGNGGFVEVSGKGTLDYGGFVDLRAPNGGFGTLLLDPLNFTVGTVDGPNSISIATLLIQLGSGNVIITNNPGAGPGDIIVSSSFSWSDSTTLTLSAFHDITINDGVTIANTGAGNLVLRADNTGIGSGTVNFVQATLGSRIDWTGSTGTVSIYYNPSNYSSPTNFTPSGQGGGTRGVTVASASQFKAYMLVNNVTDLQNMQLNATTLSGIYALGRNIDATGFVPGGPGTTFTGLLDGNGGLGIDYTISNISLSSGSTPFGGLFGFIDTTGIVRNLLLANVNLTVTGPGPNFVGLLAGENRGIIENVHVSGMIDGGTFSGIGAGGLVGQNRGTIANSSANVGITLGDAASLFQINMAGGLVGSNLGVIESSSASGNIVVGFNSVAGGLVGQNGGDFFNGGPGLITDSFATGNVSGNGFNAGGLVGFNSTVGTIIDSHASGNVSSNAAAVCVNGFCRGVSVGGLVGANEGVILGTGSFPDFGTFAEGNVHVGSGGVAGGLVGTNSGIIDGAFATGDVTGDSGFPQSQDVFGHATVLGGLVGTNFGEVSFAYATGNVGDRSHNFLLAGGFVGDNNGLIFAAMASGAVRTGNFSQAGGFAGSGGNDECNDCGSGPGIAVNDSHTISGSTATGDVTVGSSSIAGGFVGVGGNILFASATGNVSGGANSILGGFAGIVGFEDTVFASLASGSVTSTGPNSWLGGFVGWNIGTITDSLAFGDVTGASSSVIGGFAGMNFGLIDPSFAFGDVGATGSGNVMGGFVGVNFGTIDGVGALGTVDAGSGNIAGSVAGANATYINFQKGIIPFSNFPAGVIKNAFGTGSLPAIGATNPASLPGHPSIIDGCDNTACELVRTGILVTGADQVPNSVLTPPNLSNLPPPPNNVPPLSILIALRTGGGPTGPGVGPSGPRNYPNAAPGQPGFTPPPWPQRMTDDGPVPSGMPPLNENRFLQNQLVMRLNGDALSPRLLQLLQRLGIRVISTEPMPSLGGTLVRLELPPGLNIRRALAQLEANRFVPQIAPQYLFRLVQAGGDGRGNPAQYVINKFQLAATHQIATGKGVTVAVIDSEVDKRHTELQGAISEELDTLTVKEPPHPHGTAMAGAIVSRDRLMGVAPGARIIAVRAFGEQNATAEGTTMSIVKGIEWAVGQGARVINMSFAGPRDPMLERAIKAARDKGVVLVAAAGNAGPKSPPLYPGADPNVIAVTATDARDRGFRGANQGPQLSVAAPGVEVLAPAPGEAYQMSTGTSIATAHVSAVVALMLERDPKLKPDEVRRILEETATDLGPRGKDAQFGWGLVNPQKALRAVETRHKSSDASRTIR